MKLQESIKLDNLEYAAKRRKRYNFTKYSLSIVFLWDMHEGDLALEDADKEKILLSNELKAMGKGKIAIEKTSFLKDVELLVSARETIINNLKAKNFQQKIQIKFQYLNQNLNEQ